MGICFLDEWLVGKYTIYLNAMGMLGFVFFFDIFADSILWD